MTRSFRGAKYHIVIRNPEQVENGVPSISVDGSKTNGTVLPDYKDGQLHEVESGFFGLYRVDAKSLIAVLTIPISNAITL